MDNRFLDMSNYLKQSSPAGARLRARGYGRATAASAWARAASGPWARSFAAADRVLVVLIENKGVDLGIPDVVDRILSSVPGSSLIPDSARNALVEGIRKKLVEITDNLLESAELMLNRYSGSKPDFFGDVIVLRDGTSTYDDLKQTLIAQSRAGKIIDVVILTHGAEDEIDVEGGVTGTKIRAIKTEFGGPLGIRAVYMMNCKGSTLNQAWLDAGARVSSGSIQNNYLPEPTTFFFWKAWKDGRPFEEAVTSAYRKTVNLMNDTVRGLLLAIPGVGSTLADQVHFENMDFVRDSAPVVQGVRTLTINSDDFSAMQSVSNGMATTVLPIRLLKALSDGTGTPATAPAAQRCLPISAAGLDFMKRWEGLRSKLCNDAEGQCAIGYGTVLHSGACDGRSVEDPYKTGITAEAASQLLTEKCAEVQQLISQRVTMPLDQNQSDALISFVYNVGAPAFEGSTLLRVLNAGDAATAAAEIRKWTKASNNGTLADAPDLVKRRDAEASLFAKSGTAVAQSLSRANGRARRTIARSMAAVDYTVPGIVQALKQPTPKTCWATVMTVMTCWRDNNSMGIRDVLAGIGQQYVEMFDQDRALTKDIAKQLYIDAALETLESFNPTIEGWEGLLRKYGPLYVDVGYNTGNSTHAIIVTGISGDGTPGGTSIAYLDPIPGTMQTLVFDTFLAKYEAKSALNWPYTIVHWPAGASTTKSLAITHSYRYVSQSLMVRDPSRYSVQQNPAALVIAGIEVADAAQIGLAAIGIVQAQASASQGQFTLIYAQAQRLLTPEARDAMPGSRTAKKQYSQHLLYLGIGAINAAEADVIVEWEGNAYGEIGTPVIRRNLTTSTEWSKSSANITILRLDRIPLPNTDPRAWPIVYSYEGTYDPYGNGYFEFTGEFEVNAFGGLKFTRHEVVSRSMADFAIGGTPYDKVQKGVDVIVPVPDIPADQAAYLKTRLP